LNDAASAVDLVGTDEAGDVSLALVANHGGVVTIVGSGRPAKLGVPAIDIGPGAKAGNELRAASERRGAQK